MTKRCAASVLVLAAWLAPACGTLTRPIAGPATVAAPSAASEQVVELPNEKGSLKFAVLGDFGTGQRQQYELGSRLAESRERFPFDLVILVGDNIYGAERPQDFKRKFEEPYRKLIEGGVKFQASLGNHDAREQRFYKLFNMDGKLYYSFKAASEKVRFFVLDTTYPVPVQIAWLENELKASSDDWKIPYFHHPLYSSGERHGSDVKLRETLEPLFIKYNVSVVFSGHDHFYERVKPQNGIVYFIVGSGGMLRLGNIDRRTGITARGYDSDQAFMLVEISGDKMYFNAVSRLGEIIDSGIIERRKPA